MRFLGILIVVGLSWLNHPAAVQAGGPPKKDFNRDIRPILSNACFKCHGPDAKERKGGTDGLRLDTEEGALALAGVLARGNPDESELIRRIRATDPDERMPPRGIGKQLTAQEIETLTAWVREGAPYAKHWSYNRVEKPPVPTLKSDSWPRGDLDRFVLARIEQEGLRPAPEADRYTLIRRASLDLIGLPPTLEEVEQFVADTADGAYERMVDRILAKEAFGEHWARMWLDLARYADSAGYADDPPRTIWAYRDYVIRSFNANLPFDQFTLEQIAGDLLPGATEEQLVATAFHRNTLTNNEGGTSDEEFRNVAVVDRVNTTMATWMGTTMTCAQCHSHKFDPITQQEFFRFFAYFNNTEDADRTDESPTLPLFSWEQQQQRLDWQREIEELERKISTSTPELAAAQLRWEESLVSDVAWTTVGPKSVSTRGGAKSALLDDQSVRVERGEKSDVYTVRLVPPPGSFSALRLEVLPDDALPGQGPGYGNGNFVITGVTAGVLASDEARPVGRYVRVELPGAQRILSLAEVQVMSGAENVARGGAASQSSTEYGGEAARAIDGNTDGVYYQGNSVTHTSQSDNPWWEVDLKAARPIDKIALWNRTDAEVHVRLNGAKVIALDELREPVWTRELPSAPKVNDEWLLSTARAVKFSVAGADYNQAPFDASQLLDNKEPAKRGWAIGGATGAAHSLVLATDAPVELAAGAQLEVTIEQLSPHEFHTLGRFRLAVSSEARAADIVRTPAAVLAIARTPAAQRSDAERTELTRYFLGHASKELAPDRERLALVKKQLAEQKPATTVPVFRELAAASRRETRFQYRGNYQDVGELVTTGTPAAFHPLPEGDATSRLTLAKWLVDRNNPLTARVVANRFWEQLFGIGIVATSEEFGSQGELPSHPELLDYLAIELMEGGWDMKRLLKLIVTSATYRQDSPVTEEQFQRDPDNRLLARGPRFRLSAETVRDQALSIAGLLSPKLYGPPVKPPQPAQGLTAAFGGGIDWQTSEGEDRYRRALYTTWRRSNPYPSMTTFDAPNRDVCTVRRSRTNTPLQALVTLNDPVFVEAAQALGRRVTTAGGTTAEKLTLAFRLCLSRPPKESELGRLATLHEQVKAKLATDSAKANSLATVPIGAPPPGADLLDLAAWTVVGNVLLNLDETMMRR